MKAARVGIACLALGLLAAGILVGVALRDDDDSVAAGAAIGPAQAAADGGQDELSPAGDGELRDGRGNALLPWGDAPGGSWYCEEDGIAQEGIIEHPAPGTGLIDKSPREVVERALRTFELNGEAADFVGAFEARDDAGLVVDSQLFETRSGELVQERAEAGKSGNLRMSVAIEDPLRSANLTAGVLDLDFVNEFGWVVTRTGICESALTGEVVPYEPLTLEERGQLDPLGPSDPPPEGEG